MWGSRPKSWTASFNRSGAFERGTGLGLAIVHRIVSDYGGEVHVTSERGAGTRVEVTLPLTAPAPSDARALLN